MRAADYLVRIAYAFFAVALVAAVYVIVTRDGDDGAPEAGGTTEAGAIDPSTTASNESEGADGPEGTSLPTTTSTTSATGAAPSASNSPSTTGPPVSLRGVLDGQRITITGAVPSEDAATSVVDAVSLMMADTEVQTELTIEPDAPTPSSITIAVAESIGFAPDSARVSPSFFPLLDRLAAMMQLDPNVSMVVSGHADADGDQVSNLALSQRRAEAARAYLVEAGINPFRIEAVGRGDTEPIADNDTFDGRVQNRRIEFQLIGLGFATDS